MKRNARISIIIINKNEKSVESTLSGIFEQDASVPFEVIIVDASMGRLDNIYSKFPDIKVIPFASKTNKKITIPEQRNVGIRAAKPNIVVFIDAGCEPVKRWLSLLVGPILEGQERVVAGAALSTGGKTFHDVVYENQKSSMYIDQAPTINLAISKQLFQEIGYFDENLRYGSDMDFTWRLRTADIKIRNMPDAIIRHDWGTIESELKRAYHYGQAKIILYRKHKYGIGNFAKREFTLLFYAIFILLLPISILFPYYLLLLLIPVLKNLTTQPITLVLVNLTTAFGALKEIVLP